MSRRPRSGIGSPSRAGNAGSADSARLIFAVTPRARKLPDALEERRRQILRLDQIAGMSAADRRPRRRRDARISSPFSSTHAGHAALARERCATTRAPVRIRAPALGGCFDERGRERARTAAHGDAAADRRRIVGEPLQQHRARARRPRTGEVAEDRVRRDRRLQRDRSRTIPPGDRRRTSAPSAPAAPDSRRPSAARAAAELQQPPQLASSMRRPSAGGGMLIDPPEQMRDPLAGAQELAPARRVGRRHAR